MSLPLDVRLWGGALATSSTTSSSSSSSSLSNLCVGFGGFSNTMRTNSITLFDFNAHISDPSSSPPPSSSSPLSTKCFIFMDSNKAKTQPKPSHITQKAQKIPSEKKENKKTKDKKSFKNRKETEDQSTNINTNENKEEQQEKKGEETKKSIALFSPPIPPTNNSSSISNSISISSTPLPSSLPLPFSFPLPIGREFPSSFLFTPPSSAIPHIAVCFGRQNPSIPLNDFYVFNMGNQQWMEVKVPLIVDNVEETLLGRWRSSSVNVHNKYFIIYGGRTYHKNSDESGFGVIPISQNFLLLDYSQPIEQWKFVPIRQRGKENDSHHIPSPRFSSAITLLPNTQILNNSSSSSSSFPLCSFLLHGGFTHDDNTAQNPIDPIFYAAQIYKNTENDGNYQYTCEWNATLIHSQPCAHTHSPISSLPPPSALPFSLPCHCLPPPLYSHLLLYLPFPLSLILVIGGCSHGHSHYPSFREVRIYDLNGGKWRGGREDGVKVRIKGEEKENEDNQNNLLPGVYVKTAGQVIYNENALSRNECDLLLFGGGCNVFHFNPFYNRHQRWRVKTERSEGEKSSDRNIDVEVELLNFTEENFKREVIEMKKIEE